MRDGQSLYARGVAQEGTDQVDVVDAVVVDLRVRQALEEGPHVPRGLDADPNLQIDDVANHALVDQAAGRQREGSPPHLEVDGRDQPLLAADVPEAAGLCQIVAKGFLDEDGAAVGQLGQDRRDVGRGHGHVEHGVGRGLADRFGEGGMDRRHPELARHVLGPVGSGIEEARHRVAGLGIGRIVGVVHDAAGPDADNRTRRARPGYGLVDGWQGHGAGSGFRSNLVLRP